jgi:hypothetical protein
MVADEAKVLRVVTAQHTDRSSALPPLGRLWVGPPGGLGNIGWVHSNYKRVRPAMGLSAAIGRRSAGLE